MKKLNNIGLFLHKGPQDSSSLLWEVNIPAVVILYFQYSKKKKKKKSYQMNILWSEKVRI